MLKLGCRDISFLAAVLSIFALLTSFLYQESYPYKMASEWTLVRNNKLRSIRARVSVAVLVPRPRQQGATINKVTNRAHYSDPWISCGTKTRSLL